jgi:hypothetical protein
MSFKRFFLKFLFFFVICIDIISTKSLFFDDDLHKDESSIAKGAFSVINQLFVKYNIPIDVTYDTQQNGTEKHKNLPKYLMELIFWHNQNQFIYKTFSFDYELSTKTPAPEDMRKIEARKYYDGLVLMEKENLDTNRMLVLNIFMLPYRKILFISKVKLETFKEQWKLYIKDYEDQLYQKYFSGFEFWDFQYFFIYWQQQSFLLTMERFTERSCEKS